MTVNAALTKYHVNFIGFMDLTVWSHGELHGSQIHMSETVPKNPVWNHGELHGNQTLNVIEKIIDVVWNHGELHSSQIASGNR